MIENCKRALAKGTVFMNLSKIFDALNHNLLLDKLKLCDFSLNSIKFVRSYLLDGFKNQIQTKVSVNGVKYSWEFQKSHF